MGTLPLQFLILMVAGLVKRRQQEVIEERVEHDHLERNHRGLGNELVESVGEAGRGPLACRERLGGMLRYYHRRAA
jgi:putative transposase